MNELEEIEQAIVTALGVDIRSKRRKIDIVDARRIYCYLARLRTYHTFDFIGDFINIDHATVMHHNRKCEGLMEWDDVFAKKYNEVNDLLPKDIKNIRLRKRALNHLLKYRYYKRKILTEKV